MNSYKEFPEQVEKEIGEFISNHGFFLLDKKGDYSLTYGNKRWEINFYCDYGAVHVTLRNLDDGLKFYLGNLIQRWFPDSHYAKESANYVWGSYETVKFKIDSLKEHFGQIDSIYDYQIVKDYKGKI